MKTLLHTSFSLLLSFLLVLAPTAALHSSEVGSSESTQAEESPADASARKRQKAKKIGKRVGIGVGAAAVAIPSAYFTACALGGNSPRDVLLFLRRFVANPAAVGAIAPSSKQLAQALRAYVPTDTKTGAGRRILEVGAGTGAVTRQIYESMNENDHLDVVELDSKMAASLKEIYGSSPRITIFEGSITDWKPDYKYDLVIGGIPFNALPFDLVRSIWEHITKLIKPDGVFSYFSYVFLPKVKKMILSGPKRDDFINIQNFLDGQFKQFAYRDEDGPATEEGAAVVGVNLPPARVRYLRFSSSEEL